MVQTVLPTFSRVRTWQEHPGVWGKVEESLGTPCRVSLAVGACLRGSLSGVHPLPPLLWKQEGASNLLNLCVDKLSRSAEEDYPELICLFKLVVVIVTSPLPSSGILSLPSPRVCGLQSFLFGPWKPQNHLWGRIADLVVSGAPFFGDGSEGSLFFQRPIGCLVSLGIPGWGGPLRTFLTLVHLRPLLSTCIGEILPKCPEPRILSRS